MSEITNTCIETIVIAWQNFFKTNDWKKLILNRKPHRSPCGLVYELPNFLHRSNEGLAIVDMQNISFAEPHYHPDHNVEIYFVMQGSGLVVVGKEDNHIKTGDVLVIPANKAHFTIPKKGFVIAAINTPPYNSSNYIPLTKSDLSVDFDYNYFKRLVNK